jgi:hypothetical protein
VGRKYTGPKIPAWVKIISPTEAGVPGAMPTPELLISVFLPIQHVPYASASLRELNDVNTDFTNIITLQMKGKLKNKCNGMDRPASKSSIQVEYSKPMERTAHAIKIT